MTRALIRFKKPGLDDEAVDLERNVNGLASFKCAKWLSNCVSALPVAQIAREPFDEDWGWALIIKIDRDEFLLGCCSDPDNEVDGWLVQIDNSGWRGLFAKTRERRAATLDQLTECVVAFLHRHPDVSGVIIDKDK